MKKEYLGAYLALFFPKLANLYEKLTGEKIPYCNNAVVLSSQPRRENILTGARFRVEPSKALENIEP